MRLTRLYEDDIGRLDFILTKELIELHEIDWIFMRLANSLTGFYEIEKWIN